MQLLKQIWNERHANGWLWAELLIVFVALWYVVDWTYMTARTYFTPMGFDITDTYFVELGVKTDKSASYIPKEEKTTTLGEDMLELTRRLRLLPEVESVAISNSARPYSMSNRGGGYRYDTIIVSQPYRRVEPDFFQVFRYESADGRGYQPLVQAFADNTAKNAVVGDNILPDTYRGDRALPGKELFNNDSTEQYKITGVSAKVRFYDFAYNSWGDRYVAFPITHAGMAQVDGVSYPSDYEVCLRVKPGTSEDFPERVLKLSDAQLEAGNLFIIRLKDYDTVRGDRIRKDMNDVEVHVWMVVFLLVNILLGVIGTFWLRTQQRQAEIGLRMALGASRRSLWVRLNAEGLLLLTMAMVPAVIVCFNIGYLELTENFGGLMSGAVPWSMSRLGMGILITYFLMVVMILVGVWYPALQAMKVEPAETLRAE